MASVAFNVGAGYVVPTQLMFIPMLLLLPTPLVPLLVTLGALLAPRRRRSCAASRRRSAWCSPSTTRAFALAPAAVLSRSDAQLPDWASWPAYAAAVARAVRRRRAARERSRVR